MYKRQDLTAPDGYFSKLGLDDVTPDSVVMTIPTGYDYIQYEDGKAIGYLSLIHI